MYRYLYKHYRISSFSKTASYLKKQLEVTPSNSVLLTEMAWVKYNLFKDDEALEYANKAEKFSSGFPHLWYVKGIVLRSQEKYIKSIELWDKFLTMHIDELAANVGGRQLAMSMQNDARFFKASCLYCLERDTDALPLIKDHIANRRKGLESDFSLKEAKEFLRILEFCVGNSNIKSISLDSEASTFSRKSVGYMTYSQGKNVERHLKDLQKRKEISDIIAYLKRKCREFPNEYWLMTVLAEYLYLNGDKSCLKYAEKAYRMAGDDMLVVYNYACSLYLNGEYPDALTQLQLIKDKGIDYIAYSEHGEGMRWAKKIMSDTEKMWLIIREKMEKSSE